MRIAQRIARAGLASRREAESWIAAGRVRLNGKTLASPAQNVTEEDHILVDGRPLPDIEATRLWRYHKPKGLLTTRRDTHDRPTIYSALPPEFAQVKCVGRLDMNSEGLLLLTNDGALARRLELPSTGWRRHYRVRVHGHVNEEHLRVLAKGVTVAGQRYGAIEAKLERQQGDNAWLSMVLREGKNREIRNICEHFGWPVTRLIRTSFGPFQLGELPRNGVEEVPAKILRTQLGIARPHAHHRR
ncbi:MAG TPA: pseudouridine synthase [Dongiaceae bacterium]|jgi:23S rRNA pseudouridine2605 synthase|nr:pseudouridine synthase [Dongiaceae bacterium]